MVKNGWSPTVYSFLKIHVWIANFTKTEHFLSFFFQNTFFLTVLSLARRTVLSTQQMLTAAIADVITLNIMLW